MPHSIRDDIDYITPGVALREVKSVGKRSSKIQKRSVNGVPPILEPILMPLEDVLDNLLEFCDTAVTPQCIKGEPPKQSPSSSPFDIRALIYNRNVQHHGWQDGYEGE